MGVKMIFLDSSYIKGLILKNDDNNRYSKNIKLLLKNETKAINVTVLLEALNAVRKNNYQDDVDDLLDCLINFDIFDILLVPDYEQSLKWFKYYGKTINFADCTIKYNG